MGSYHNGCCEKEGREENGREAGEESREEEEIVFSSKRSWKRREGNFAAFLFGGAARQRARLATRRCRLLSSGAARDPIATLGQHWRAPRRGCMA